MRRRTNSNPSLMELRKRSDETELLSPNSQAQSGIRPGHSSNNTRWKFLACLLILIILALIVVIIIVASRLTPICSKTPTTQTTLTAKKSNGIFESLSPSELEEVQNYMLQRSGLPLVDIENAEPSNAYVFLIDLHLPNKTDVLNHLDEGGPKPTRCAKVYVTRGDMDPPRVEEYLVNIPNPTSHELYQNPSYGRDPIPHTTRPADPVEHKHMMQMFNETLKRLYPVLYESYGAGYHNCTRGKEPCLILIDIAPRGRSSGQRRSWAFLLRDVSGYYLHPIGFQLLINHEGTDRSRWGVIKIYYNGRLFDSTDELIKAYDSGTIAKVKVPFPKDPQTDLFSQLNQRGEPTGEPLRPPKTVYPDGQRYTVDGTHVTYMGWEFDFHMNPSTGIKLFDIRFGGKRTVYEFGNVDALVFYSGHNPMQGVVGFYDASWLLGVYAFELAKGMDCPEAATYFDYPYLYNSNKIKRNRNSVCLFEHDNGVPLGRHFSADFVTGKGYRNFGSIGDHVLILRYIPVIWNYDYIIDYIFHQDGVLEGRVSTSGYLQATFYSKAEERYSYKVANDVVGPMHHHVLNFKADVDVGGQLNRFATLDIKMENKPYPWSEDPQEKVQKYFTRTDYASEKKATIKYNFDMPKYYLVYNNNSRNALGYPQSLRIKLSGMSKLLMPVDKSPHNPANAAALSQYQLAVTKHKDYETSSTSLYSQNDPYDPIVDFDTFIADDESIVDEDLVVWASLGVHHIPSVEDVPVTTTSSNRVSLFLLPYNYHDVNPIVRSRDLISIVPNDDLSSFEVQRNGVKEGVGCVPEAEKFAFNGTTFE